ncbi:predicted protein [Theileria orientalis strain Shintoku]|uniref:CW-type domain-containing protein n=1 Tax=Theileria orientalis strain Shintoku TaxID=869250 RepID=J4C8X4_THEOR|nr:predicted protein [Theileria orientalis strain Shintoku]BAM41543.1 predicted protein [Theileria orientalis strain Shintoku]|eukprot:XP_009691844.1 predicted protein [Theileria orientalis strain Shintoku]
MAEKEIDSKYEDNIGQEKEKNDINIENINVDHRESLNEEESETKDRSMSLIRRIEPDSNDKEEMNQENKVKSKDLDTESEVKPGKAREESQNKESSDLIKELSVPIELDPNFGPEKVSYDIDDLNIPIKLEDAETPTNLKELVKKLDIPCDTEAMRSEMEQAKQKQERNMLTRYSKRNGAMQKNLNFRINGMSYKNQLEGQDLSTSLNFRELSKKLDLNRSHLEMPSKYLRSSRLRMNKLNLDDFSKLDMNTITNPESGLLSKLDANTLSKLDLGTITKLDVNSAGKLDINETNDLGYKKYLQASDQPLSDNEYVGGNIGAKNDLQQEGGIVAVEEMEYGKDGKYTSEMKYGSELKARQETRGRKKRPVRPKNEALAQTVDASELANQGELPPLTVENWAQCENCKKWRRIPLSVDTEKLPDTWVCALNVWDPTHNACSIPEEIYPEKMGDQRALDINGPSTPLNSVSPDQSFSNDSDFNYQGYLQEMKYEEVGTKGSRERTKVGENYKAKYADARYRAKEKYRSVRDERESDAMRTPTNTNRYYEEARLSSRRRMHISPMVSNISSYDEDAEVIKFNVKPTSQNLHPLKNRMTLYSHNLTSLLATELPHSALFLDNLKRMNMIKDDDIVEEDTGGRDSEDKDNVFFKEDGNINIAYANKTEWEHEEGHRGYAGRHSIRFNKEDIFDNLVTFGDLEDTLSDSTRGGFARMYKRLASQIPNLTSLGGDGDSRSHDTSVDENMEGPDNGEAESVELQAKEKAGDNKGAAVDAEAVGMGLPGGAGGSVEASDAKGDSVLPGVPAVGVLPHGAVGVADSMLPHGAVTKGSVAPEVAANAVANGQVNGDAGGNGLVIRDAECGHEEAGGPDNGHNTDEAMALDEGNDSATNSNERSGSESVKTEEAIYERSAPRTYGTRSSAHIGRSPNSAYSQGNSRGSMYERTKYSAYGRSGINGYDGYTNGPGERYGICTRNSSSYERNRGSSYGTRSMYSNCAGSYERPVGTTSHHDTESKTDVVNRDELLEVLYSFAKQGKQAVGEDTGHKSVHYCKRYKYVDGTMQSIIDYKEQIVDKLRQEMLEMESAGNQQSSLEEYDSAKREEKIDETLESFRDDDYLLDKSQAESEEDLGDRDDASEKLERELENEFKKELMEKELESKLLRNEKNRHLDYPLPNAKQLSKRCRNLESKSLRRHAHHAQEALGSRMLSNYSLLFQPIPDDIAASSSSDIIKMLSVPIPYKSYGDEYEEAAPGGDFHSLRNGGAPRGSGSRDAGNPGEAHGPSEGRPPKAKGRPDAAPGGHSRADSLLLNGRGSSVPFASGVVGAGDLVSSGIMGRGGALSSGGSGHASSAGGSGEELKLEKFENFDLLTLPIPDLGNATNTQCVN